MRLSSSAARAEKSKGSGAWIAQFRAKNGYPLEVLGREIRRLGSRRRPGWPMRCSDVLLEKLENTPKAVTHPNIANLIAEALGATAAQRDAIVAPKHRGTWKPRGKAVLPPYMPVVVPRGRPKTNAVAYAVVCVDKFGHELERFPSITQAAIAYDQANDFVIKRCNRRVKNEFKFKAYTFRYQREWDQMTAEQRQRDLTDHLIPKH